MLPSPSPSTSLPPCTCLASCSWLRCTLGTMDYCVPLISSLGGSSCSDQLALCEEAVQLSPRTTGWVWGPRDLESRP